MLLASLVMSPNHGSCAEHAAAGPACPSGHTSSSSFAASSALQCNLSGAEHAKSSDASDKLTCWRGPLFPSAAGPHPSIQTCRTACGLEPMQQQGMRRCALLIQLEACRTAFAKPD